MKPFLKKANNLIFILFVVSYYSCSSVSELYLVKENDKWGYIDKKGKLIIEPIYENCCYQRYEDSCCSRIIWPDALGIIKLKGKYGAINIDGDVKIKPNYDFLDQYHNSLVIAKSGQSFGVLNANGDTIFPFIFDNQFISCNNVVGQGQIEGKYYLLNFSNKTKAETNFDKISYFVEGLAAVIKDNKYGFVDESGEIKIDLKYQNVWPFNKGVAAVKLNYQWGFIDINDNFIIEPQFDETEGFDLFDRKYAIVEKNKKYGIINREGDYIVLPKYEYLYFEDKNVLSCSIYENKELKSGLINLNEKWLYQSKNGNFDYLAGYIKIEINGSFGLIKLKNGKVIIPPLFDEIAFRINGLSMLTYYDKNNGSKHFSYVNKKGKVIWSEKGVDIKNIMELAK